MTKELHDRLKELQAMKEKANDEVNKAHEKYQARLKKEGWDGDSTRVWRARYNEKFAHWYGLMKTMDIIDPEGYRFAEYELLKQRL